MEFIGNKVNAKEIAAVVLITFFIGRIRLFDGTFPAAAAWIVVMLTVSTVYIYLLPPLAAGIASWSGKGIFFYDDLLAICCLGFFFLFFHRRKFSMNQRIIIAVGAILICSYIAYDFAGMVFLLRPVHLIKTVAALFLYIRVFHTVTKLLYTKQKPKGPFQERVSVSMEILVVSLIGAVGIYPVVFSLWLLAIALLLHRKGLKEAVTFTSFMVIFSLCQGEMDWEVYIWLFCALTLAWFVSGLFERRYRKLCIGVILFFAASMAEGLTVFTSAAAMTCFIVFPWDILTSFVYRLETFFCPETDVETDLKLLAIRKDLLKKREAFDKLGRLYGSEMQGKQIVSFQFTGMARTIDKLLTELKEKKEPDKERILMSVSVGQASYSFEPVSGDSMTAFAFDEDQVALIISDGMGKGSRAAEESKMVVTTLSRLLQAGFDVDLAMKTINGILMTGNQEERFATVDLAIIDRRKGRAKIYKMGAATTFIKHDGRVSMLKRQALPAGIVSGLDLEYIDIKLKRGDLLVMVSDGVTDCDRKDYNCDWLRTRLLEMGSRDPETVAELVVNKAAEKYGIHERDDLTVMTAAIGI